MRGPYYIMGSCHVITGTPGTGKHTLAMHAGRITGMDIIDITEMAIRYGLLEPDGVDTAKLADAISLPDAPVIVVGHLAAHVVPPDAVSSVIVLRRSPYELESVYRIRRYPRHKMLENLGAEILGLIAAESYDTFGRITQIDTTGGDIDDNTRKVVRGMRGRYISDDDTDWLGQISDNGDISRFFDI